jgi:RNA polymerase sigma-70 factor (ECF subfamily)
VTDEQQLVSAAKNGSSEAFNKLLLLYQDRLYRFLLTRCSLKSDAEDVLQETFINAFKYMHTYDERWRFSTWLYRIALRKAATFTSLTSPIDDVSDAAADPLEACMEMSERENLWLAAKRILPDELFTAMWLRYAEDMDVADISKVLGRSVSWTKVGLMRGRNRLKSELADDVASSGV